MLEKCWKVVWVSVLEGPAPVCHGYFDFPLSCKFAREVCQGFTRIYVLITLEVYVFCGCISSVAPELSHPLDVSEQCGLTGIEFEPQVVPTYVIQHSLVIH